MARAMAELRAPSLAFLLVYFGSLSFSMKVTSESACQPVCAASAVGTTADDVVCLDNQFASTTNGTNFQQCVECELGSTAVDSSNGATDVNWGLYNLRYAFSTCVFDVPVQKVSISTPCQVSCTPLQDALVHDLNTNATFADLSYCNLDSFQDTAGINRCAECYGRMDGQAYMANFLQALHIACLEPPRPSRAFGVAANTIFNSTPIATPTPSSTAAPGSQKPANLALIIALPVVFGVVIIAGIVACCFYSARHRRRIMAQRNGMRRIHDKYSPTEPPSHEQYYQHEQSQAQGFEAAPQPEPAYSSPVSDQKENPYIQAQQLQREQNPQQPQYPIYRSYSPADYAPQQHQIPKPPTTDPIIMDTSQIGPGPDQKKVHTLHDQYFPPPPPLPPADMQLSPGQEGVESLRQHHMNTPSLGLPLPRGRRSMDPSHQQVQLHPEGSGEGEHKEARQTQEYGDEDGVTKELHHGDPEKDKEKEKEKGREEGERKEESPQVFVYDAVNDRYIKENRQDSPG